MWLSGAPFTSQRGALSIYQKMGSAQKVFGLTYSEFNEMAKCLLKGTKRTKVKLTRENYEKHKEKIRQFETYYKKVYEQDFQVVSIANPKFPKQLQQLIDCPLVIYGRGDFALPELSIGIVGARRCSNHGKKVAYELAKQLSSKGVNIVSGLAYGIDIAAHRGALSIEGKTTAVLGGGLHECYPKAHEKEFNLIGKTGLVMSEEPVGRKTEPYMFPKRNRLISGLSKGVIVVEAAKKSGSLITVDFALEQGRDVFSVPGRLFDKVTEGSNELIVNGAKAVYSIEDILSEYAHFFEDNHENAQKIEKNLEEKEKIVYSCISYDPIHQESILLKIREHTVELKEQADIGDKTLIRQIQTMESMRQSDILMIILSLEMKGVIIKKSGCYYARSEV